MNILQLSIEYPPETEGGLSTHLALLNAELVAQGNDVAVLALATSAKAPPDRVDGGISVHWFRPASFDWRTYFEILTSSTPDERERRLTEEITGCARVLIGQMRPDILHLHGYHLAQAALRLSVEFGLPLVWTAHSSPSMPLLYGDTASPYLLEQEQSLLRRCAAVIAPSVAVRDLLRSRCPHASAPVYVVYNGMDLARFQQPDTAGEVAALRRQLGGDRGRRLILYAGRLAREKGIIELVDSATIVQGVQPSARYVLVGSRTARHRDQQAPVADANVDAALVAHGERLGIDIRGFVEREKLPHFYAACDIAIVPSLFEPFGYAALEAMSCNAPLIVTDGGGLAEVARDGIDALVVKVRNENGRLRIDPRELAEAQLRLLSDPGLAANLARSAAERVRIFSARSMCDATLRVYGEAVARAVAAN